MIHGKGSSGDLTEEEQLYDVHGRFIRAVDRAQLNRLLLDELQSLANVKLHFYHKLTGADMRKRKAWFEQRGSSQSNDRAQEIEISFDFMLGCDGAHSSVRYHLMKFVRMDYQQNYIDTIWSEFTIPPTSSSSDTTASTLYDGFAMSPHHLHIWPSKEDMFIAIPSTDKSFTCTLFASSAAFSKLEKDPTSIKSFFDQHFPGVADLIGASSIQKQFEQNPHLSLINIKCQPHHFGSVAVIIGDAAHAMVPFYGQGMNAGLEDVNVLFSHLDRHPATESGRAKALEAYSLARVPDAHSINDLALANYWEMHAGVRSPVHLLRKKVEEFLSDKLPWTGFQTQYSRVSFSNQRYSEVRRAVSRQSRILLGSLLGTLTVSAIGAISWSMALISRESSSWSVPLISNFASIWRRLDKLFRS